MLLKTFSEKDIQLNLTVNFKKADFLLKSNGSFNGLLKEMICDECT